MRKSIFITIPWFYPAYKAGGPIQSIVNMINELKEGYTFYVFCGNTDLNNEKVFGIKTDQWVKYNAYTSVWYASAKNRSNTLMEQVAICKPDILYIVGLFDWHFNIVPLMFCKVSKKILSVRGMLHPGALTQKKFKKQVFLQGLKIFKNFKNIRFHATDKEEEKYLQQHFGDNIDTIVASNIPRLIHSETTKFKEPNSLSLVSIALISPMKNHLEVIKALTDVKENITYNIYGPIKDLMYWKECFEIIQTLPENIKVQQHGDIQPMLVSNVLNENDVFILPSKSENYGHAIIEALSTGLPVITSNNTPWNNLDVEKAGVNLEPNSTEITKAISFFVKMNNEELQVFKLGAANYARKKVNLIEILNDYKIVFE